MICVEKLTKYYGKKQVLKGIDMTFEKGEVYGIVGENGAGKTTLFRCIAGLESYDGQITSDYPALKDHLGLLLTEPFIFAKITGREYIQLLANARQVKITNIADRNVFDLPLDEYASTYSTGMKKKLAITAILVQENDVFILDEPFNGVDIQSNLIITEIIKKLRDLNKIVLISSHIFSTLADTCNKIYLLKEGSLVRKVEKEDFATLESEMKDFTVGNCVNRMNLK